MGILERMSLLRASLRFLPFLALAAACTGKRADPEPSQNPPPVTTDGGAGGGTTNGGAPTTGGNGGNGGAPSTGGMGGVPSTGGMGGMSAMGGAQGTAGNNSGLNLAADIYPYCGCLSDAQDTNGACDNCVATAACAAELANCPLATCGAIVTDLRACAFGDLQCYDDAYANAPNFFDDAVDLIACECTACADPICDGTACGG